MKNKYFILVYQSNKLKKIAKLLRYLLIKKRHFFAKLSSELNPKTISQVENEYKKLGLERNELLENYRILNEKIGITPKNKLFEVFDNSEHLLVSIALSRILPKKIDILEIGTFAGETTTFFSNLFPFSVIDTIDLPKDVIEAQNLYKTSIDFNFFLEIRSKNTLHSNVFFHEMNSLELFKWTKQYNFIFVDGDHKAPITYYDLVNAVRLCKKGGFIMVDDVYVNPETDQFSIESRLTLKNGIQIFLNESILELVLRVPKRLRAEELLPWKENYIYLLRKKV